MEVKLTKDAEYMICALYKEYIDKRKNKTPKEDAKFVGSSEGIQKELMSQWTLEDVDETCRELDRAEFLECLYAEDTIVDACLTDNAIIYMENRFIDGLTGVLDYMGKIRAILPF